MEYLLFCFGLSISLASFDEVFAQVIHTCSFYCLIQNLTLPIVLTGFFYPCDLNLEVLSLRLGFNLVIHVDGISHPYDSNLEFLPLSLDSNLVIFIDRIFHPCDLNLEFFSLKLDFNLVILIDGIFYPCNLNLEFLSLKLDFNLVILIDGIFYPCDLNLEFSSLSLDFYPRHSCWREFLSLTLGSPSVKLFWSFERKWFCKRLACFIHPRL